MRPAPEQTVLVTGTTDGLGRALAEQLARQGVELLMHGRDPDRLGRASCEISRATGNDRITPTSPIWPTSRMSAGWPRGLRSTILASTCW